MVPTSKLPLTIALIQMTSSKSLDDNLAFIKSHVRQAASRGASYVLTPENSLIMDLDATNVATVASSDAYKLALQSLCELAAELEIWLHIGATAMAPENSAAQSGQKAGLVNRSLLIDPDGQIKDFYDKIHMFDARLPNGENYHESASYQAGDKAVVVDCGFARIGMSICYDLRFPALYRQLAHAGAGIITVPAAFTQITGKAHWQILLQARAIETGCFILASAQTGMHETGRGTYGHSLAISPWGEILLDAGQDLGVFIVTLDLDQVISARSKVPSLQHDRKFHMEAPL